MVNQIINSRGGGYNFMPLLSRSFQDDFGGENSLKLTKYLNNKLPHDLPFGTIRT